MFNFRLFFINVIFFLLIASSLGYAQTNEQITLTTYYPSPQGSYVELRSRRLALGDNYLSPVSFCWPPTACANVINGSADLVVEGRVGIGTITPTGALAVNSPVPLMGAMTIFDEAAGSGDVNMTGGTDSLFTWFNSGNAVTGATYFRSTAVDPILYLKNNGNVGIGTNNPAVKLDVAGNFKLSGPDEGPYNGLSLTNGDITVDGGPDGIFGFQHSGNGASIISFGTPYWPPNTWTMTINTTTGNVGIGTQTPGYNLTVAGTVWCASGAWEVVSDARLKKDIRPLENSLGTILKLQGVSFKWINPEKGQTGGLQRGFIAQDVEKVIPEWVKTDSNGYKSLEKVGVEALLVEAIKEQQRKIERLETEMIELKSILSSRE